MKLTARSHLGAAASAPAAVYVYVATNGSDSSTGTAGSPLQSIAGAQAWIRTRYPTVSARPRITVLVDSGDYFYGRAPFPHIGHSTRYSGTAQAHFSAEDSGASAANPITFAALHPDAPRPARFIGGLPLGNLTWVPATEAGVGVRVAGIFKAKIDPTAVEFDVQDQLFLFDHQQEVPLVRGREPNGRPWIPQDGFNLKAKGLGVLPMAPIYTQCAGSANNISSGTCTEVTVVCGVTNATQISGSLGTSTAAGAKLAGRGKHTINASKCLKHLLGLANDWPNWHAASYGVSGNCTEPLDCVNTMDTTWYSGEYICHTNPSIYPCFRVYLSHVFSGVGITTPPSLVRGQGPLKSMSLELGMAWPGTAGGTRIRWSFMLWRTGNGAKAQAICRCL